ncbi:MAG TPA: hypothetical protein VF669_19390 [Tepidisphaeraceae bacterium]|jgi:hypothetical protein
MGRVFVLALVALVARVGAALGNPVYSFVQTAAGEEREQFQLMSQAEGAVAAHGRECLLHGDQKSFLEGVETRESDLRWSAADAAQWAAVQAAAQPWPHVLSGEREQVAVAIEERLASWRPAVAPQFAPVTLVPLPAALPAGLGLMLFVMLRNAVMARRHRVV